MEWKKQPSPESFFLSSARVLLILKEEKSLHAHRQNHTTQTHTREKLQQKVRRFFIFFYLYKARETTTAESNGYNNRQEKKTVHTNKIKMNEDLKEEEEKNYMVSSHSILQNILDWWYVCGGAIARSAHHPCTNTDTQARTHGGACNARPIRRKQITDTNILNAARWYGFNNHTRSCTKPRLSARFIREKRGYLACDRARWPDDFLSRWCTFTITHSLYLPVVELVSLCGVWHSGALRSWRSRNEILIFGCRQRQNVWLCLPERETATQSRGKSVYTNTTTMQWWWWLVVMTMCQRWFSSHRL